MDADSTCNATVTKAGKQQRKLVGPDDKVIMVKWANCYPDDFEGEAARFFVFLDVSRKESMQSNSSYWVIISTEPSPLVQYQNEAKQPTRSSFT